MKIRLRKPLFSLLEVLSIFLLITLFFIFYFHDFKDNTIPDITIPNQDKVISEYSKDYDFSTDWFTEHLHVWDSALSRFKNKPDIKYLEVGVFEGRAFFWVLENILSHPTSKATAMDLFEKSFYDNIYSEFSNRFFSNLDKSELKEKVEVMPGYSQIELRKLPLDYYDIIYIDGSHENDDVLEDAIISWRLLKSGGILIFDDYGKQRLDYYSPRYGINSFYKFFHEKFELLHVDHQLFLRKK